MALYDNEQHQSHAFFYGLEPGVQGLAIMAVELWLLGYPDQALKRSHEALALAQTPAHPPDSAGALIFATVVRLFRREASPAHDLAQALIALAAEYGLPHGLACGTIFAGWSLAEQGCAAEGVDMIQKGLRAYRATGAKLFLTHFLGLLAQACARAGQVEAAMAALAEGLAMVTRTQERIYEAELHRLKGELMLMAPCNRGKNHNSEREAEVCFLRAIGIANHQGARSFELRAVVALSRLWLQQGNHDDARRKLIECYGGFSEGFDTADLQEAKALMEVLDSKYKDSL